MFLKKNEPNEEELKQKRMELDASLQKADQRRKEILEQKRFKLKKHSKKVDSSISLLNEKVLSESINVEITRISDFLTQIEQLDTLEKFQIFMQKPDAVENASKLVEFIERFCNSGSYETVKNRPKVLMSLVLLANFPNEVMPNASQEENEVLLKSKVFYKKLFEFVGSKVDQTTENHTKLSWCWVRTVHAFDEWLAKDKHVLFEKMRTDFLTWVKTVGNLSVNDPSRYEWEHHAVKYQNEILKRIHEIFGTEQIAILLDDVREMNNSFETTNFIIEYDQEKGNYECDWQKIENNERDQKIPENTQSEINEIEKLKKTNIRILHELMLKENNIDFEGILNLSGKSMKEISETNKKNICQLISALENESNAELITNTLQELFRAICSSLIELAGENEDYCQEIELTDCSIEPNSWIHDSSKLLRWILSMCKRCCAPVRDQTCRELELCIDSLCEDENIVNSFTNIFSVLFDLINDMRSDFCNFRLRFLAAQIEGKGIVEQYELDSLRMKFSSDFRKTEQWLEKDTKTSDKPLEHLADMYLKLFDPCQDEITETTAPETFYLDVERVNRYREELKLMLVRDAALIYTKNHLKSSKCSEFSMEELLSEISVKTNNGTNIDDVRSAYSSCTHKFADYNQSLLEGNVSKLFSNPVDDKVFILLKNRIMLKVRSILINEQKNTQPHESVINKICALFKYNKACFSSIYDAIIFKSH